MSPLQTAIIFIFKQVFNIQDNDWLKGIISNANNNLFRTFETYFNLTCKFLKDGAPTEAPEILGHDFDENILFTAVESAHLNSRMYQSLSHIHIGFEILAKKQGYTYYLINHEETFTHLNLADRK